MQYNPALDGLRAVSALAVVGFHCAVPGMQGGFFGVTIFFVLSGYLITSLLADEIRRTGAINLPRFYYHRLLRLYPPLLAMLLAWAALMPLYYPDLDVLTYGAMAALYLTDYAASFVPMRGHLNHTWSLGVEEKFYLVWPLVLLWCAARPRQSLHILVCLFIAATLWRVVDYAVWQDWKWSYHRFDTTTSGLALGGVIAVWGRSLPHNAARAAGAAAVIVLFGFLILPLFWAPFVVYAGDTIVQLAAATLIIALCSGRTPLFDAFAARPVAYLGKLSYAVYLWHYPIAAVVRSELGPGLTAFAVTLAITLPAAVLSYELIERPIRAWRLRDQKELRTIQARRWRGGRRRGELSLGDNPINSDR